MRCTERSSTISPRCVNWSAILKSMSSASTTFNVHPHHRPASAAILRCHIIPAPAGIGIGKKIGPRTSPRVRGTLVPANQSTRIQELADQADPANKPHAYEFDKPSKYGAYVSRARITPRARDASRLDATRTEAEHEKMSTRVIVFDCKFDCACTFLFCK